MCRSGWPRSAKRGCPLPQGGGAAKGRLSILYEMYLDCVHTAKDLGRRAQRQEAV